ncbi:MAG: hypothetical protein HQL93_00445 [Magnetococcales bacterium]|nr:hypothetical protein [Magnetococcales bacterium]
MSMVCRDSSVASSTILMGSRMKQTEHEMPVPEGWSSDFLLDLFSYHMGWLGNVSGLNEAEAKRRVLNLFKSGKIGYQDEAGNKRTLPGDVIVWVNRNA